MYAIIVREYFSPHEAGARIGVVVGATQLGMALGGWMSGAIFDLTGSYRATFVNAFVWNLLNLSIVLWLLSRGQRLPDEFGRYLQAAIKLLLTVNRKTAKGLG
jgi:MFS family permease